MTSLSSAGLVHTTSRPRRLSPAASGSLSPSQRLSEGRHQPMRGEPLRPLRALAGVASHPLGGLADRWAVHLASAETEFPAAVVGVADVVLGDLAGLEDADLVTTHMTVASLHVTHCDRSEKSCQVL